MNDIIDLAARKKAGKKQEEYSVKELLHIIAEREDIEKMEGAIVVLLDAEGTGRLWVHNLTDVDLLWYAEMLKNRALSEE